MRPGGSKNDVAYPVRMRVWRLVPAKLVEHLEMHDRFGASMTSCGDGT